MSTAVAARTRALTLHSRHLSGACGSQCRRTIPLFRCSSYSRLGLGPEPAVTTSVALERCRPCVPGQHTAAGFQPGYLLFGDGPGGGPPGPLPLLLLGRGGWPGLPMGCPAAAAPPQSGLRASTAPAPCQHDSLPPGCSQPLRCCGNGGSDRKKHGLTSRRHDPDGKAVSGQVRLGSSRSSMIRHTGTAYPANVGHSTVGHCRTIRLPGTWRLAAHPTAPPPPPPMRVCARAQSRTRAGNQ